jgi:hypothetical protein
MTLFTSQLTPLLLVPLTVAVKDSVPEVPMDAVAGDMLIATLEAVIVTVADAL